MAEPARKMPTARRERMGPDDEPGITLLRFVERPDGTKEQVELRLTPELFLNPQVGDQWMQGTRHYETAHEIFGLLKHHFLSAPDVKVTSDLKHFLDPELPAPCPDISVIRGIRNRQANRDSFDVAEEDVLPCLIIEVVSPLDSEIRETDLDRKVEIYQDAGIPEYIVVDSTLKDPRYRLLGYRLDRNGHYRPINPDAEERLFSETTSLWFQSSPDGKRVLVFEHSGGRRLLNLEETADRLLATEEKARAAQARAEREAEAREAAEAEIARLKAELDRLRRGQ
jgi:Uma2 family endonuclease